MTQILSQDEIDALLEAISTGESHSTEHSNTKQKKVKIYDFKRPDKFSKDNIFSIQNIHEVFAKLSATSLTAQLRTNCYIHVCSVDQLTYEEAIRSIPNPTTLAVINLDPLKGSALLEIDPKLTFAILSYIFGAETISESDADIKLHRELTDIELSIMEGIIVRLLGNLRESWSNAIDLRPRLGNIETNPRFAQIVPSNDMCVMVSFECNVGDVEGIASLVLPFISIESVLNKLTPTIQYSSNPKLGQVWEKSYSVDVEASICSGSLSVERINQLELGSVIFLTEDLKLKLRQDDIILENEVF